ncbi:MAG: hypothetical protein QOE96_1247 [Blastocatellia bacterium]|nr:hypothetical protein [Blastocatellia bacterium]
MKDQRNHARHHVGLITLAISTRPATYLRNTLSPQLSNPRRSNTPDSVVEIKTLLFESCESLST